MNSNTEKQMGPKICSAVTKIISCFQFLRSQARLRWQAFRKKWAFSISNVVCGFASGQAEGMCNEQTTAQLSEMSALRMKMAAEILAFAE